MADELDEFVRALSDFAEDNKVEGEIEFPIEISSVDSRVGMPRQSSLTGKWVSIRPVGVKETYLGVYLGDFPVAVFSSYNTKTKKLSLVPHNNPAIYVPDLKRVVWGCESWWGTIKRPEDLEQITDTDIDIENIWYVKALKELSDHHGGAEKAQ